MDMDNQSMELAPDTKKSSSVFGWLNWTASSITMLRTAEKKILSYLKLPYRGCYVDIGPVVGESDKIWTISQNTESEKTPLVLLHGFGSGVALWVLNLDAFAKNRPVYAIDVLGFGRSSRPTFDRDGLKAEKQIVLSVEEWRREMNIKEMILLGHSMGGFLATSYAMDYPDRVKHLILADPWGFPEKPVDAAARSKLPFYIRAIAYVVSPLNPLWALRVAGPLGPCIVEKARADINKKFSAFVEDDHVIPQYIHQCNAQSPSGESAFHSMMNGLGWAKNPMVKRMHDIRSDIPITLLYGSKSWIDNKNAETIKESGHHDYINVEIIEDAGHNLYADQPEIFNLKVNDICNLADSIDKAVAIRPISSQSKNDNTESEKIQIQQN